MVFFIFILLESISIIGASITFLYKGFSKVLPNWNDAPYQEDARITIIWIMAILFGWIAFPFFIYTSFHAFQKGDNDDVHLR